MKSVLLNRFLGCLCISLYADKGMVKWRWGKYGLNRSAEQVSFYLAY